MADGATDQFRSTFLRLTGGGQACTVTLAPNTLSHTWIMRNETAAALTLTQGSGANVVIAAGQTKIVATDGAGSGAIVYEMDDLELAGNLTVTGVLTTTAATVFNGGFASNAASTITTADNTDTLSLISTDADASSGPNLNMFRNSSSPADSDELGNIAFNGRNDNSQTVKYAEIEAFALDVSDGTEDAVLNFNVMQAGTAVSFFKGNNTEVVVNDDSRDLDFRVESDGNANMLFVDGGNNNVNIGSTDQGGVRLGQLLNLTQTANFGGMSLSCYSTTNSHRHLLDFNKSGQATPGSHGVVADGEHLGSIFFRGDDGDEFIDGAQISAVVDGTPGNGDMPTMLTFSTTPDGAAASSERLRITNAGLVGIGAASPSSSFRTSIYGDGSSIIGGIEFRNAASGGATFTVGHASATSPSGTINVVEAGNLTFNTTNAERARFVAAGEFCVGTAVGVGEIANVQPVTAGRFRSFAGAQSAANNTATTMVTLPAGFATYIVNLGFNGVNNAGAYGATAIIHTDGTTTSLTQLVNPSNMTISLSGMAVQGTQTSGATLNISFSILRM